MTLVGIVIAVQTASWHRFSCYNYNRKWKLWGWSDRLGVNWDNGSWCVRRCRENAASTQWYCYGCQGKSQVLISCQPNYFIQITHKWLSILARLIWLI